MNAHDEDSNAGQGPAEPHGFVPPNESSAAESPAPESPTPVPSAPEPDEPQVAEPTEPTERTDTTGTTDLPPPDPPPAAFTTPAVPAVPAVPPVPAPTGVAALSLRYQIVAALALAVVAVAACVHLGMVFLHVAPSNTVTRQHGRAIDEWVYPEFEQNWKLFAPNPLQQNIAVQVRAEVRLENGSSRETGWYDLSALDGAAIDGNLLPSHTQQNELRRAWDFYVATHDSANRPMALRGALSEKYLRRIVVLRLDRDAVGGDVERVQVRSRTTNVPPPEWNEEQVSDKPVFRVLPWWSVAQDDRTEAQAAARTAAQAPAQVPAQAPVRTKASAR